MTDRVAEKQSPVMSRGPSKGTKRQSWDHPEWSRPYLLRMGILFVAYYTTAKLGIGMDTVNGYVALVWPPAGISFAALILFGRGLWPGIFFGNFAIGLSLGATPEIALSIAVGSALEPLVGLYVIKRFCPDFHSSLERLRHVLALIIIGGLCSTAISATVGVTSLYFGKMISFSDWFDSWRTWWIGDSLGILVFTPLLLIWMGRPRIELRLSRVLEGLALAFSLFLVSWIVCGTLSLQTDNYLLAYLFFPGLIWAALRFGMRGTVTAIFSVSMIAILFTIYQRGPFVKGSLSESLFFLQSFLGVLSVTSLVLASTVSELVLSHQALIHVQEELIFAKDAAEAANHSKSAFLSHMSHEIRTPLTAVIGFSELLTNPEISPEKVKGHAHRIKNNGQQLLLLINDILDLSKVEAGKVQIENNWISLVNLCTEVATSLSPLAKEKGIQLNLVFDTPVPEIIFSDPTRLKQILVNIVGNAVKFTNQGYVTLRVQQRAITQNTKKFPHHQNHPNAFQNEIKLEFIVEDTGIGISLDDQNKLFQTFVQADNSVSRKFGGTGLGLILSKRLAQLLRGDLVLSTSEVDKGSVFTLSVKVLLPKIVSFIQPQLKEKSPNALHSFYVGGDPERQKLSGIRVLVVDDVADNQEVIRIFLEQVGAIVEIAQDGLEGIEKALSGHHHVILMDISMPRLDGFDATRRLRERGYEKPILALTAYAFKSDQEYCIAAGCNDHITKPVDPDILIKKIKLFSQGRVSRLLPSPPQSTKA